MGYSLYSTHKIYYQIVTSFLTSFYCLEKYYLSPLSWQPLMIKTFFLVKLSSYTNFNCIKCNLLLSDDKYWIFFFITVYLVVQLWSNLIFFFILIINLMIIQRPTTVSLYSYVPAVSLACWIQSHLYLSFSCTMNWFVCHLQTPPVFSDFTIQEAVEYIVLAVNYEFMFTYQGVSLEFQVFTNWFVIEVKGTTSTFRKSIAVAISIKEPWLKLFCLAYYAAVSICFFLLMAWS